MAHLPPSLDCDEVRAHSISRNHNTTDLASIFTKLRFPSTQQREEPVAQPCLARVAFSFT